MKFTYIGAPGLLELCDKVTLNVKQSDNTYLIVNDIMKGTIIDVEDVLAIKYIELDPKYQKCQ